MGRVAQRPVLAPGDRGGQGEGVTAEHDKPDVRLVGLEPGDRLLVLPGAAVTVAMRADYRALMTVSVQAEKDGALL